VLLFLFVVCYGSATNGTKPHVMFILVDDLGHAELGYHREKKTQEVQTPSIDALVDVGVNLNRHYVHKFCSPTRCAIQSGRAPIHVNVINIAPEVSNASDPMSGFAGIPRNMTGISAVMKSAGYSTHMVGKWDAGMATPEHTPAGRGYDTSLIYYHHSNDYWTFTDGTKCSQPGKNGSTSITDLWNCGAGKCDDGIGQAAKSMANPAGCTQTHQTPTNPSSNETCMYEDALFEERVHTILNSHNAKKSQPLFLFWSTHIVHGPLQGTRTVLYSYNATDSRITTLIHDTHTLYSYTILIQYTTLIHYTHTRHSYTTLIHCTRARPSVSPRRAVCEV
jgi:arylsulfatase I/J